MEKGMSHGGAMDAVVKTLSDPKTSAAIKSAVQIAGFFDAPLLNRGNENGNCTVDEPVVGYSHNTLNDDLPLMADRYNDNVDPLDIAGRITSCRNRIGTYTWKTTDATGAFLPYDTVSFPNRYGIPVTPTWCNTYVDANFTYQRNTELSFFAQYYALWRGDLEYEFEAVNTAFHQGHVIVAFVPGNPRELNRPSSIALATTPSYDDVRNCMCATINLNPADTVEKTNSTILTVPFVSTTAYRSTGFKFAQERIDGHSYYNGIDEAALASCTGMVYVFVENPLTAANTVPGSIEINVYIRAKPGFQFKVIDPIGTVGLGNTGSFEYFTANVNGGYQMDKAGSVDRSSTSSVPQGTHLTEVVDTGEVSEVAAETGDTETDYNAVSAFPTADTQNILGREYVTNNFDWLVSAPGSSVIKTMQYPKDFYTNVAAAATGVRQFHLYEHMDFEMRVQTNPTQFHAGVLRFVWVPWDVDLSTHSYQASDCLPHLDLNLSTATSGVLRIPYSALQQVIPTTTSYYGTVYVIVWNQLSATAAQAQSLHFTVWSKMVNPYIAVKTVNAVVKDLIVGLPQGKKNLDGTTSLLKAARCFGEAGRWSTGVIKEDHMNARMILHRPEIVYIGDMRSTGSITEKSRLVASFDFPYVCGRRHLALMQLMTFVSGNVRYHVMTCENKNVHTLMWSIPQYNSTGPLGYVGVGTYNGWELTTGMNGLVMTKMCETGSAVIELASYRDTPFVPAYNRRNVSPHMLVGFYGPPEAYSGSAEPVAPCIIRYSVGDNFAGHMRLPPPLTRYTGVGDGVRVNTPQLTGTAFVQGKTALAPLYTHKSRPRSLNLETGEPQGAGCGKFAKVAAAEELEAVENTVARIAGGENPLLAAVHEQVIAVADMIREMKTQMRLPASFVNTKDLVRVPNPLRADFRQACALQRGTAQGLKDVFVSIQDTYRQFHAALSGLIHLSDTATRAITVAGRTFDNLKSVILYYLDVVDKLLQFTSQLAVTMYVCSTNSPIVMKLFSVHNWMRYLYTIMPTDIPVPTPPPERERGSAEGQTQSGGEEMFDYLIPHAMAVVCNWLGVDLAELRSYIKMQQSLNPTSGTLFVTLTCMLKYLFMGKQAINDDVAKSLSEVQDHLDKVKRYKERKSYTQYLEMRPEMAETKLVLEKFVKVSHMLPKMVNPIFGQAVTKAQEELKKIEDANKHYHGKPEPIVTYLVGNPGSGKTSIVTMLSVAYAKMTQCNPRPYFWPTDVEQTFADGYENEDIVVFDDAQTAADPSQLMTAIRLFNCENIPVNMADLREKGARFTSRFVIMTSNIKTTRSSAAGVNNPEAFVRRMTFPMVSTPRAEWTKNGQLDQEKFQALLDEQLPEGVPMDVEKLGIVLDTVFSLKTFTFDTDQTVAYSWSRYFRDWREKYECRTEVWRKAIAQKDRWLTTLGSPQMDREERVALRRTVYPKPEDITNPRLLLPKPIGTMMDEDDVLLVRDASEENEYAFTAEINQLIAETHRTDTVLAGGATDNFARRLLESEQWKQYFTLAYRTERRRKRVVYEGIYNFLAAAVAAVGMVAMGAVIYKAVRALIDGSVETLRGVFQYGHVRPGKAAKPSTVPRGMAGFHNSDADRFSHVQRNIRRVAYYYIKDEMQKSAQQYGLVLNDRFIVIPQHFMRERVNDAGTCLYTQPVNQDYMVPLQMKNSTVIKDLYGRASDLALIEVVGLSHARDITSSLCKREQLIGYVNSGRDQPMMLLQGWDNREKPNGVVRVVDWHKNFTGDGTTMLLGVQPDVPTKFGDCGRTYVGNDALQYKIIGVHTAGNERLVGMAVVCQETIAEAMAGRVGVSQDEEFGHVQMGEPVSFWESETMVNLGRQKFNEFPLEKHPVMKTCLVPFQHPGINMPHKDWQCDMKPAAHTITDGKHPLYTNVQKYGVPSHVLYPTAKLHDEMSYYFCTTRIDKLKKLNTPLTMDESINGFEREGLTMDKMVLSTSCGYWTLLGFKDGKKEFFDMVEREDGQLEYRFSEKARSWRVPMWNMSFCERLEKCHEMVRQAKSPFMPWVTACKDEMRPIAKVLSCKTRTIEMPGIEHTILSRMYFGHFIAEYKAASGTFFHHGIGKDKPVVWSEYYKDLTALSMRGFDVDYKNYDGTVTCVAYRFFRDVTDHYYAGCPQEDTNARHALLDVMQNAYLIVGENLCCTTQGNKSGTFCTDVFNSITNTYVIYYSFAYASFQREMPIDFTPFDRDICFITYGDDVIVTRTSEYEYFDRISVFQAAQSLGMNVTSARKDDRLSPDDPISELTFLCSAFVPYRGTVLCPMKKESIYKELCYRTKSTVDDETDFRGRVQNTCTFMAEHGEEAFEEFKKQLLECGVPRHYLHCGQSLDTPAVPVRTFSQFIERKRIQQERGVPQMDRGDEGPDEVEIDRIELQVENALLAEEDIRLSALPITQTCPQIHVNNVGQMVWEYTYEGVRRVELISDHVLWMDVTLQYYGLPISTRWNDLPQVTPVVKGMVLPATPPLSLLRHQFGIPSPMVMTTIPMIDNTLTWQAASVAEHTFLRLLRMRRGDIPYENDFLDEMRAAQSQHEPGTWIWRVYNRHVVTLVEAALNPEPPATTYLKHLCTKAMNMEMQPLDDLDRGMFEAEAEAHFYGTGEQTTHDVTFTIHPVDVTAPEVDFIGLDQLVRDELTALITPTVFDAPLEDREITNWDGTRGRAYQRRSTVPVPEFWDEVEAPNIIGRETVINYVAYHPRRDEIMALTYAGEAAENSQGLFLSDQHAANAVLGVNAQADIFWETEAIIFIVLGFLMLACCLLDLAAGDTENMAILLGAVLTYTYLRNLD
jgi:hypothetical protein